MLTTALSITLAKAKGQHPMSVLLLSGRVKKIMCSVRNGRSYDVIILKELFYVLRNT